MILNLFGRKIYVRKDIIAGLIAFMVVGLGVAGFMIGKGDRAVIIPASSDVQQAGSEDNAADNKQLPEKEEPQAEEQIKVYVTGCVNNPGIVTVKKGEIIDEAIKLAGGATEEADMGNINLVYKLRENVTLHVKSREESKNSSREPVEQKWSSSGEAGPGINISADGSGAVLKPEQPGNAPKKVNINSAPQSELETLPGVGKETAKDIISYREKSGGFKTINDIMKVSGIKESRFNKIKDSIVVD